MHPRYAPGLFDQDHGQLGSDPGDDVRLPVDEALILGERCHSRRGERVAASEVSEEELLRALRRYSLEVEGDSRCSARIGFVVRPVLGESWR